jgi:peptide/nickel transport system substrate-binding protein
MHRSGIQAAGEGVMAERWDSKAARVCAALSLLSALASAPVAQAQDLRVGLGATVTSLDPQFYVIGSNSALARNMFDGLVNQDDHQHIVPGLASSWRAIDATTWEFPLKPGLHFDDGGPVEAEDVAASLRRVPEVRNSPSSFLPFVRSIASVEVVDPHTVRIHTKETAPLLPNLLSRIAILPRRFEKTDSSSFTDARTVIGTGPYRLVAYQPGDRVELEAADPQPGAPAPTWKHVTMQFIPNDGARSAALLAGDVDMIEDVPSADIGRLRQSGRVSIVSVPSNRVMYLDPDQDRERTPFATALDGSPIANPFRDLRVRQALSLAIDRQAIVARIMDGQGMPTGQLVPQGFFGYTPSIPVPHADPAAARRLLAEAGLLNGFKLTFHASNDRYPNDARVAQALAQMWTRIGIQTQVVTEPGAVYFSKASNREYTLIMGGAAAETGEASSVLRPLLATYDPARGNGSGNRGRYSNPQFDTLLRQALAEVVDAKREELLQQATEIAMHDEGVIPLFLLSYSWATRPGVVYAPRADGWTLAANAVPSKP